MALQKNSLDDERQKRLAGYSTISLRNRIKLFLVLFLAGSFCCVVATSYFFLQEKNSDRLMAARAQFGKVTHQAQVLASGLQIPLADIRILATLREVSAMPTSINAAEIEEEFIHFVKERPQYLQLRLISRSGKEIVRIDHTGNEYMSVEPAKLQNKSSRYYFKQSISLPFGTVYVSPLDLNVESEVVQVPYVPVIRLATPVKDALGNVWAVVVINFKADKLLESISSHDLHEVSTSMLLNRDGYWLVNGGEADWAFMFESREGETFASKFPEYWEHVSNFDQGQVFLDHGLLTWKNVYPLQGKGNIISGIVGSSEYVWRLVSLAPAEIVYEREGKLLESHLIIGIVMLMLIAGGCWGLATDVVRKREYHNHLKELAHYDTLTNLPNRALFFDRLRETSKFASRYGEKFCLLFVDIDDFKTVNDTYGHDGGDDLLVRIAQRLSGGVRESDTVARMGGDEFVVLLPRITSHDDCVAIGNKLLNELNFPFLIQQKSLNVHASIGYAVWPDDADTPEALLQLADKAMYKSKMAGKNRLTHCKKSEQAIICA